MSPTPVARKAPSSIVESSPESPHAKILAFLVNEFARKDGRQCVRIELFYAPGGGYRDEPLRDWTQDDYPEIFESPRHVENLVLAILQIAEDEAEHEDAKLRFVKEGEEQAKPKDPDKLGQSGRHFVVRTHQHFGGHQSSAFTLCPPYGEGSVKQLPKTIRATPNVFLSSADVIELLRVLHSRRGTVHPVHGVSSPKSKPGRREKKRIDELLARLNGVKWT
jgi:hypothetical protein